MNAAVRSDRAGPVVAVVDWDALDKALLEAHAAGDATALVGLYTRAGDARAAEGDADAAGFYFTQAFVFALEAGLPDARELNIRLADMGRADRLRF